MKSSHGSVTGWLHALQDGDREGAQQLWDRFSRRLLALARQNLHDAPRGLADEEDVALSAFDSFCRAAEKGRLAALDDRGGLWQLLVVMVIRKAIDYRNHERRQKRGGGLTLAPLPAGSEAADLQELLSREPGPALAAMAAEECRRLLHLLGKAELKTLALLRVEGYTNEEIAQRVGCTRQTVQRRLRLIRQIWEQEVR
jgi:RNA polymerase sigma factor (sigma-70 family)